MSKDIDKHKFEPKLHTLCFHSELWLDWNIPRLIPIPCLILINIVESKNSKANPFWNKACLTIFIKTSDSLHIYLSNDCAKKLMIIWKKIHTQNKTKLNYLATHQYLILKDSFSPPIYIFFLSLFRWCRLVYINYLKG